MKFSRGLDESSAIGSNGMYSEGAEDPRQALPTCVWHNHSFLTSGAVQRELFSLSLPDKWSFETTERSWTGRKIRYTTSFGRIVLELRNTLPGAHFTASKGTLFFRWASGNDPDRTRSLCSKTVFTAIAPTSLRRNDRVFLLENRLQRTLLVTSELASIEIISNRHWVLKSRKGPLLCMVVPLLPKQDERSIRKNIGILLSLLESPPLHCTESFAIQKEKLILNQSFVGSRYSPVPPTINLATRIGTLVKKEGSIHLLDTNLGPYSVHPSSSWNAEIDLSWLDVRLASAKTMGKERIDFPDELCYAGDFTWNLKTSLDRLLAWRTWAPLLQFLSLEDQKHLLSLAPLPTIKEWESEMRLMSEPSTGIKWKKYMDLYDHWGDVAFDHDWYNGLTLSGLGRAAQSSLPALAKEAKDLLDESKDLRREMVEYFFLFHDWEICGAVMDPRGGYWNADCSHNGWEGLIAEYRNAKKNLEKGCAEKLLYLIAKSALLFHATWVLPEWLKEWNPGFIRGADEGGQEFMRSDPDERIFSLLTLEKDRGMYPVTPATRNPYVFPGHLPELAALIKRHVPKKIVRKVADAWEKDYPLRYEDWERFYVRGNIEERKRNFDQEARTQAAVFFHLAPDICTRLWILDEPVEKIRKLFKTELNAAEKVLLECDVRLVKGAKKD